MEVTIRIVYKLELNSLEAEYLRRLTERCLLVDFDKEPSSDKAIREALCKNLKRPKEL